jgi:predicted  nucleic acid-binding Zn-ribbon protein
MAEHGLHRGLELRLEALAARIAALRQKMSRAKGAEKIEAFGEVDELDRRYAGLAERLRALDSEGPGLRQNAAAEVEKLADDLSGALEDFTMWVDSGYQGDRPTRRGRKP